MSNDVIAAECCSLKPRELGSLAIIKNQILYKLCENSAATTIMSTTSSLATRRQAVMPSTSARARLPPAIGFSTTTRGGRSATTSTSTLSIPGPPVRLCRSTTVGTSFPRSTSASSRTTTSTPKTQREQSLYKFNQFN